MNPKNIYRDCYRESDYKMGPDRRARMNAAIRATGCSRSMLDVGCGRGELLDDHSDEFRLCMGAEIVPELCDGRWVIEIGSVTQLPWGANAFELVVCADVLEHIPPGDSEQALRELWHVADRALILHVAWFSHKWKLPNGEMIDLHCNKREMDEWLQLISRVLSPTKVISETFGRCGLVVIS